MRSISDTIARLQRFRPADFGLAQPKGAGKLIPLESFGSNPGDLDCLIHVPAGLPREMPLVVVLHGCTQTAEGYDRGSGWSALADRFGFAVLFAQQRRTNNPNLCFNWFVPADNHRIGGEAESIRQMVIAMAQRHSSDLSRVFVTGLSAGGAMTSVMLATSPDLFAGGAIIAGLAYRVADDVPEALDRMRGNGFDRPALSRLVRDASDHQGRWPAVSVWHGTADATVHKVNADVIVDQWREMHGVDQPDEISLVSGQRRRAWRDGSGRVVLEHYAIEGLGHGTPITTLGDEASGVTGPYMLEAGISSTYRIAASWGIVPVVAPSRPTEQASAGHAPGASPESFAGSDAAQVIAQALRAAGLMKR